MTGQLNDLHEELKDGKNKFESAKKKCERKLITLVEETNSRLRNCTSVNCSELQSFYITFLKHEKDLKLHLNNSDLRKLERKLEREGFCVVEFIAETPYQLTLVVRKVFENPSEMAECAGR